MQSFICSRFNSQTLCFVEFSCCIVHLLRAGRKQSIRLFFYTAVVKCLGPDMGMHKLQEPRGLGSLSTDDTGKAPGTARQAAVGSALWLVRPAAAGTFQASVGSV